MSYTPFRSLRFPSPVAGVCLVLCLSISGPLAGQVAPGQPAAAEEEPSVVLSPFVVSTNSDVGYEASESLAGTGLRTKLTDLGASVSVITSKFIEDTGSNNLSDVLVYQTNMEVRGFGGNSSGVNPSNGGIASEPSLSNGITGTRIRGLAEASQARNFFRSIIPMHSYNTDRVEINRGANALLFGVGSPAGIINTSSIAAELQRSHGEAVASVGSHGSWRVSFDYNAVPRRGEFAVRVAAVKDDEKYQQKFAFTDTERQYAAATWDIAPLRNRGFLDSTIVRASFEQGRIRSNNPRLLPPSDRISSWFDSTLPENLRALGARGKVSYDPGVNPGLFRANLGTATIGTAQSVNRSATFFFANPNATAPRDISIATSPTGEVVLGRAMVSNNVYFPWSGVTSTAQQAGSRDLARIRFDYGFPDQEFYTAENMTDPSVFDFFNNLIVGPNSEQKSKLEAIDFSLQQLAFNRTVGLELAFNRQRWTESQLSLINAAQPYVSIDVNTRMWTGELNPNFGRPFISDAGNVSFNRQEIETSRAKLFYELNLEEKMTGRLGRVLGKHVFSLLAQREELSTRSHSNGSLFYTPDFWINGNNQSRSAPQSKAPTPWIYLGPSLAGADTPAGANLSGLRQNLMNFHEEVTGQGVVLTRKPAPNAAAARLPEHEPFFTPIDLRREDDYASNTATSAALNRRILDSQALSLQSNWLSDTLVSTVGWRKEASSIRGINAPIISNGENYALVDDPSFTIDNPDIVPQDFEQTLFAWSGVAKTPQRWLRRIPIVSAFNVYYGESENFSPPDGRTVNAFGTAIAPPSGTTEEKGIYLEAFDGKLTARVNFFETTQTGSFNGTVGSLAGRIVGMHTQAYNAVRNGWVPAGANGFPVGYVPPPAQLLELFDWRLNNGTPASTNPGVQDTSDFVTKGTEIELMFRPARGLSILFNVSEQKSVRTNTGAVTRALIFDTPTASGDPLAVEWRKDWTYQIPLSQVGTTFLGSRTDINMFGVGFQRNILNTYNIAKSADGAPVHELRRWRANFVGNYEFQGETLKGFAIGGGVRWLDKAALGYPLADFRADLTPIPAGESPLISDVRISDVRNPYFGPSETRYDAWISYSTKLRQGKYGLKLQLNVRNLFTEDELVPSVINPDGTIPVWSVAEGRRFTFMARFSF